MSIFCVSDLHLCDRGPRDTFVFGDREKRFHQFLDYVEKSGGQLYILGDLFDWWQANLSASVRAYKDLLERLACVGVGLLGTNWIAGNHDSALTDFIGTEIKLRGIEMPVMSRAFETTIGGRRFAVLHGHESDPYCRSMNPGTGEITAIISGMLEDRNQSPFDRRGHAIEDEFVGTLEAALTLWRKLTFQHGRLDEMIDNVEAYRKEAGADVVIYGHTHEPGQIGNFHYNTGSWCRKEDTFVRIENDGAVSLWQWTDRPIPLNKCLR
jgi:UDP-2,3-diacylglucosamine pyrophosphatase LpxH